MRTRLLLLPLVALLLAGCKQEETMTELRMRVFDVAVQQMTAMDKTLQEDQMPRTVSPEGDLVPSDISWWCSGFYPGSLWILYENGGDPQVKALAEKYTERLTPLLERHTDHDIGFMINCSFGHAYDATRDTAWLPVIEGAAEKLAARLSPVTGTIRSWDWIRRGKDWKYPVIIDNMMNLELLMRAAGQFGRPDFRDVAVTHARTTAKNHFRPDYSTFHLVDYDPEDGHVRSRQTVQGYSDDSAWARGQAWGLYGYTMMYKETGLPEFLDQAEAIAKYIMGRLPEDGVPYWDFDDPAIPEAKRDASAGAITASALLDLARLTKDASLAIRCNETACRTLRTLASPEYLAEPGTNANFLLRHSVGNLPSDSEVDVPLTYADYYFLEALTRLPE